MLARFVNGRAFTVLLRRACGERAFDLFTANSPDAIAQALILA
jgi:hypothetical protein